MSHLHHGNESIARPYVASKGRRLPQIKIPSVIARALLSLHSNPRYAALSRSSKDVLAYLVRLADIGDACAPVFAFKRTIADKIGLSESSVYRALNELTEENIIIRETQARKERNGRLSGARLRLSPAFCAVLGLPVRTEAAKSSGVDQASVPRTSEVEPSNRAGEGNENDGAPSVKMTDGQCITVLKALQSLQKHSPGIPTRLPSTQRAAPRTKVPEELLWLIAEKNLRESQIFLLMGEFSRNKRRLSDAVECTKARLQVLAPREVFAYLRALAHAPTDFAWIVRQRAQSEQATRVAAQVRELKPNLLTELDGQYLVNASGAVHRVEAQVESAEVWWRDAGSDRVRTGYVPVNEGFLQAVLDGRLVKVDPDVARVTIDSGLARRPGVH